MVRDEDKAGEDPRGFSGQFSGVRFEAERCPDCTMMDTAKSAAGGGLIGFGLSFLLGGAGSGRFLAAAIGAGVGIVASRYHLNLDWDPDGFRGVEKPEQAPEAH